MRRIRALAPAKINLTFDIVGSLPDGYHEVQTILQSVDLQDEISVEMQEAAGWSVGIDCLNDIVPASFPLDESNLMARAAKLYCEQAGVGTKWQLAIAIQKNIPVGAGLAGGSTDAAAILLALNTLFDNRLSESDLMRLAAQLGADVPFCLLGGTAVGTARGDKLRPIDCKVMFSYCVLKPGKLSVSTPWAYQKYDAFRGECPRPNLQRAEAGLANADIEEALASFGNVFEPVIFEQLPELTNIKQKLLQLGCWYAQLSGSGPAIFGIVADREQAHYLRRKLLKSDDFEFEYVRLSTPDLGPPLECYIAQSLSTGVTVVPDTVQVT